MSTTASTCTPRPSRRSWRSWRAEPREALGPNQMVYEDNAFPRSAISTAQVNHSFAVFSAADARAGKTGVGTWQAIPNDKGTVPGKR